MLLQRSFVLWGKGQVCGSGICFSFWIASKEIRLLLSIRYSQEWGYIAVLNSPNGRI